ncbi:MAG: acetyl-CoA carboxylase carboxyl transferase subunit beta, partial [Oscillospiraceae bacterium]
MLEDLFKVVKSRLADDNMFDKKAKVDIPQDLLFKCPRCQSVMFMEDFVGGAKVCSECSYHARLTVHERLDLTIDKGSFEEYDKNMTS